MSLRAGAHARTPTSPPPVVGSSVDDEANKGHPIKRAASRAWNWIDLFTSWIFGRIIPLVVWVMPSFACLRVLSYPTASYCLVVVVCVVCAVASYRSFRKPSFKFVITPCSFTGIILLLNHLDWLPERVFVWTSGVLGVVGAIGQAMFSVLIGNQASMRVQEVLTAIALGCPLLLSVIYILSSDSKWYSAGVLLSTTASGINVFFNKRQMGTGVPQPDTTHHDGTGDRQPGATDQAVFAPSTSPRNSGSNGQTDNGSSNGSSSSSSDDGATAQFLEMLRKAQAARS